MSEGNQWLDDVKGGDASEDDDTPTLFEDNFRDLVQDGDIETLNVQTIKENIADITDQELLAEAVEVDSRTTAEDAYQDRIGELNQAEQETETDDGEPETDNSDDAVAVGDEGESEEEEQADDQDVVQSDGSEGSEDTDEAVGTGQSNPDEVESENEGQDTSEETNGSETSPEPDSDGPEVDVNVAAIAPDAKTREEAIEEENPRDTLVWGQEGTGKTHVAHTAPGPIAYIDTEGKADEIADKFDKEVFYFEVANYQEASDALDRAFDLLSAYRNEGVTGTVVVDSLTKMWGWAKEDYQQLAYPSADGPGEVDFKSALQGEDDWTQIKRRHNTEFRQRIVESPYNSVFTATAKEDYNAVMQGASGKPMVPDGEKDNAYVVMEVVRLRVNDDGTTVGDLHKSARTRRSFKDLQWPDWDSIYDAIDRIAEAEKSEDTVDVSSWPFGVVDGKPTYVDTSDEDDE